MTLKHTGFPTAGLAQSNFPFGHDFEKKKTCGASDAGLAYLSVLTGKA
jgi:hypothetical protein